MDFDRDFILRTTEGEPISPALDKNDRNLFKGLTQETVEMDRRVNIEKRERVAEDARLQAEIDKLTAKHEEDVKTIGGLIDGINKILSNVDAKLKDLEARVEALEAKP